MVLALAFVALLPMGGAASATPGVCACGVAMEDGGWCDVHRLGYIGGVEIRSARLYEVLDAHGHELDLDTFTCPQCRRAIESDGYCEEHRVGFVDGLAFYSKLAYHLARAEKVDLSAVTCPVCLANARSRGWCDEHGVGLVGGHALGDRNDFEEVAEALRLLELANEAAESCERCAVAIVTDSLCVKHRLRYENGVATPIVPEAE